MWKETHASMRVFFITALDISQSFLGFGFQWIEMWRWEHLESPGSKIMILYAGYAWQGTEEQTKMRSSFFHTSMFFPSRFITLADSWHT